MKCYKCGASIPDDSKYCPRCQAPQGFSADLIRRAANSDQEAITELYNKTYSYDLVFLCTVENIIVHADGSVTTGEVEIRGRGTSGTENTIMDDLTTWYTDPAVESVGFAG